MTNLTPEILLVDDDRTSRTTLKFMLRKVGYHVLEAADGEEGLMVYQRTSPTLILLDARMPGMDGFDCCRRIRQLPEGEHVPILMVTGLDDQPSVDDAFEAGATDYVTKPVQLPVLMGRIRYLIQAAQSEQALRHSEEKYRSLINSLQEVIFQLDQTGELIFVNLVWHSLMHYNVSSSLGKKFESFLHPAEQERHRIQFDKAWKQPSRCYQYRSRCLTQDGNVRWVNIQLCANKDNQDNVLDITGRLIDITDRTVREQYRSLEYAISRVLTNAGDVTSAIRRTLQAICGHLSFHLGEFWHLDSYTQELRCLEQWHLRTQKLQEFSIMTKRLSLAPGEGVVGQVWQLETSLWITHLDQDCTFVRQDAAKNAGFQSVLSFPVHHGLEKLGVVVFFSQEALPIDTDRLRMLTIVGRQLSQYLKRKQAEQEIQCQNQLLQLELQRASEYVEALLPNAYDKVSDGCKNQNDLWINTLYQPSSALGGDAFDYAWLDDEHLMFYLLDVAGHGVKSALLSVSVLNILRTRTLNGANFYKPETVLEALNNIFQANENGEDYFTLWYGVYNVHSRQLRFASAGHPPGILVTSTGNGYETHNLDSDNIAVGLLPDFPFNWNQCDIPIASHLYIFSDGVYEVPVNNDGDIWGFDAWTKLIQKHTAIKCSTLQPLLEDVRSISSGNVLDDDFSILEVRFI